MIRLFHHPERLPATSQAEEEGELMSHFEEGLIGKAKEYLSDPGISVVTEAAVHALHDPTEGGLATGIYEMAAASGLGAEVYHQDELSRIFG